MSASNSPKATHIYMVSITYFVLRFCERFFTTHSIIYVTGTNIYIYTRTCIGRYGDAAELIRGYQRFLPTDIKHYLSRITERFIK
jgi:hypothetical protein